MAKYKLKETTWKKVLRIVLKNNIDVKYRGYSAPIIAKNILSSNSKNKLNKDDIEFLNNVVKNVIF